MSLRRAGAAAPPGDTVASDDVGRGTVARPCLEPALEAALECTTDGILVAGADRRVCFVNGRFAELWRLPVASVHGTVDRVFESMSGLLGERRPPEGWT